MIVIVSSPRDAHAAPVIEHLKRLGAPVTLLDLSAFPQQLQLSLQFDGRKPARLQHLRGPGQDIDFAACRVIWWRRPQSFALHAEVSSSVDRAFAYTEGHAAFSGLWLMLDAFWINHPTRDEEASRKVYQLKIAQELGLRIPHTCVTSDPVAARKFIDERGAAGTIYKAFAGTEQAWRETRLLKTDELRLLETVRFAPVIFQEYIAAAADLRITVVGDKIFPAAIYAAETSYPVDFRMAMGEARIEAVTLPDRVTTQLRQLMKRLGLVYGAIDLRLTPKGEYVFLEINPSGQWLFIEERTNQPITAAIAGLMARKDRG